MDMKLELVLLPVADVERVKAFYIQRCGFELDVDHAAGDDFRVVQLTPPGSACSVAVGKGITDAAPGSVRGLHLVVTDISATRDELKGNGVEISEPRYMTPQGWQPGVEPDHADYATFADFKDPDGNVWVLQEVGHGKV